MRIDRVLYKYIERELYNYPGNVRELELERESILDSMSSSLGDGQPRGNKTSNPTLSKVERLMSESTIIVSMDRRVRALERTLQRLSPAHRDFFKMVYCECRRDKLNICDELFISGSTYDNYKHQLIALYGYELGILDVLA